MRSGKKTGPGRLRSTATTSANARISGSLMPKIFTFSRNAFAISGKPSRKWFQLKNWPRTSFQPGACTTAKPSAVKTIAVLTSAIERPSLRPSSRGRAPRAGGALSSLLEDGHADDLREPRRLDLPQRAVRLQRRERAVHAADERTALLEDHPEVLRVLARCRQLAEDRRIRHLHRGHVEGGRQVDDEAVDQLALQREHGLVVRRVDGLRLRLDHADDGVVARRPELGAELVRLER